ncbi:alginate lyase family protein [Pedobacter sp. SD-b]|uniref:Alginate lyase family protein n=1 Tax=Pedobacter segetis TaxID=2793069 RepID=A0ABS1BHQ5_9SPHI|nr:alginate lyase family protein [Pedobacter segetis]MBK0382347.1 alginate lyase family protein [Pedobacter segetis]
MKKTLSLFSFFLILMACSPKINTNESSIAKQTEDVLKEQTLKEADWAMKQEPITVTAQSSERSAGGKHDFYSEGDYWWPDPQNPNGPYIQKDGLTNPDNFVAHRFAMIRFSKIIGALASAYKITGDEKYVKQAVKHLKAWFVNPKTLMNPNLQFAQAIKGRFTGRGIGIIDTIHLLDVAQGTLVMSDKINPDDLKTIKNWFANYLQWLMTSKNGHDEMNAKNNHGTCFTLQIAGFAKLTANQKLLDFCSSRYKTVLLPDQMATDGSFPLEMARTKPYGYSIFNLDAITILCQILSTPQDNLFAFETADGKSIKKGIEFMYPFIADKSKWTLKPDVMYWNEWPVAQPSLIFGAIAYQNQNWFNTWKSLEHNPKVAEIIRNLPIKYPLIWMN